MVQAQAIINTDIRPAEAPPVGKDSGSRIATIMNEYRARIEEINSRTTVPTVAMVTGEARKRDSQVINDSRLRVQRANSVVDGLESDVKKLEVYDKLLMMVRRSLTVTGHYRVPVDGRRERP